MHITRVKKNKKNDNIRRIKSLVDNYYNLFVDSVSLINQVDYHTLNMIKKMILKNGFYG